MKRILKIFVLLFIYLISLTEAYVNYENYKVYKVVPKTDQRVQILNNLSKEEYYFWSDIIKVDSDVRVLVSPTGNEEFELVIALNPIGASSNPCDETYAGPSAASEPETKAISNYVLELKNTTNFMYYLAFHSFSQMILIPYSHLSGDNVLELPNYTDLYELGIRGAEKLKKKHGTEYQVGTSADILYAVSGASFDWVKGVGDASIVYLFELRDKGDYGFLLPPEQIIPNNEEIMECLLQMDRETRRLGYYSGTSNLFVSYINLVACVVIVKICQ